MVFEGPQRSISIPQAMRIACFTMEESKNRVLQMRVRRFKHPTDTKIVPSAIHIPAPGTVVSSLGKSDETHQKLPPPRLLSFTKMPCFDGVAQSNLKPPPSNATPSSSKSVYAYQSSKKKLHEL